MSTITVPQTLAPIFRIRERMRDLPASALPVVDAIETELDQLEAILAGSVEVAVVEPVAPVAGPEALLMEHPQFPGSWTVWLAAYPAAFFGRYATREDARRGAARMGFHINMKGE